MLSKEIIGTGSHQVMLEILNANEIQISGTNISIETLYDIDGVTKVVFKDLYEIVRHEKIAININGVKHEYNITKITKLSNTSFLISHEIPNKCTLFLLPVLGNFKEDFSTKQFLINSYVGWNFDCLFLLYRYISSPTFIQLDWFLRDHKQFISTTNPSFTTVAYEFKIPEHYINDVLLFKDGKYSEFSDALKNRILSFHGFNMYGHTASILYKDSPKRIEYKKQLAMDLEIYPEDITEIYSSPDMGLEIYNVLQPI